MAEYVITAKIDPSGVTTGANKVKQDLRGLDQITGAIERGFDKVAAAAKKANDETSNGAKKATDSLSKLEAAHLRVLQATDAEAAEQEKLNRLLRDAEALHAKGVITQNQLVRVQTMVTNGVKQNVVSLGQQRAGFANAGQQVQDWTQQLSLGVNPLVVLAQQGGQTASALSMALGQGGTAGKVATFIAGPWGALILAGVTVLGMMIYKNIELNGELDKAVQKLGEDARETEVNRQAKEKFIHTAEGVRKAILDAEDARKKSIEAQKTEAERTNDAAQANLREEISIRKKTAARLADAKAIYEAQKQAAQAPGPRGEVAALGLSRFQNDIDRVQRQLDDQAALITKAETELNASRGALAVEQSRAITDAGGSAKEAQRQARYAREKKALEDRAAAEITTTKELTKQQDIANKLVRDVLALRDARDADIKKIQEQNKAISDGVARFKSQAQAVGIAGRELQRAGLRVSENEQFGGITPGAHKSTHKNAIDVNSGTGVTEADVPDLRKKFDELARRYQARGYRVLWNGWVYEANGSGPTRRIPGGQDQHRDHMHVEAPSTIVGKATNASGETQANKEENDAARVAEQKSDFISGVVDQAATRGMPAGVQNTEAQIAKVYADYKRRFNVALDPNSAEGKQVTGALTDAAAREQAERFNQAYVEPLRRLQELQGKTGLDREILNAQLEESAKQGKEISLIEKVRIAVSMKLADMQKREQQILEDVKGPVNDYRLAIEALNAALAKNQITQDQFNARVSNLGMAASQFKANLPGLDSQGRNFADQGAKEQAENERMQQLDRLQMFLDQGTIMEAEAARIRAAIWQQYADKVKAIDTARKDAHLASAQDLFGSLTEIAETGFGKQSAVYKAMFAVEKAIAIARAIVAIQTGIAEAAANPFPYNLAAMASVAAATASIVSSIAAVKLNFADGGLVRGPGGTRGDKIPANLSDREFVVNAAAVERPGNLAMLEAINRGSITAQTMKARQSGVMAGGGAPGGDSYQLTFGDIHVNAGNNVSASDGRAIGRDVRDAVKTIVREEIASAKRPGGALTKATQSAMI